MIRKILFIFFYIIAYRKNFFKISNEYFFIRKNLFNPLKKNKEIQQKRLYNILKYAIENVPFYQNFAKNNNIKLNKETIFEDLQKFPILTKEIIRKYSKELISHIKSKKYIINTSGGTTGEPVRIIQDQDYLLKQNAATLVFDEIGKYFVGNKLMRIWGNERDIIKQSIGFKNKIINYVFKNTLFLNSFKMSKKKMLKCINKINNKKVKNIIAYSESIFELAKFIKKFKLRINGIESIITSASVLTNKMKDFIEDTFHCKVYNRYGSREVGLIAMSCGFTSKLHINMFHQYVEILNDKNQNLSENQTGNIIITNLTNYTMPIIRYKIGDLGSLSSSQCLCGMGLSQLNKIIGRTVDVFKNINGELIDGEYFTHIFYFMENIKQFQIIQTKIDEIIINLVTLNGKKLNPKKEQLIKEKIKIVMGKKCNIIFSYHYQISPSTSGKFRFTISKIS
ncbi:MAG: phenylacetate--CoA ligase family protein [Candidatus Helarchaeota archaeon]